MKKALLVLGLVVSLGTTLPVWACTETTTTQPKELNCFEDETIVTDQQGERFCVPTDELHK